MAGLAALTASTSPTPARHPDGSFLRSSRFGPVPAVPYKERTVSVFRGDHLATIRQDDLDLDHLDVWRLERQPA